MITGFMLNDKICCNLQKMSLPIGIEGFELLNLWISQLYAHVNKTILTKKMGPKIVLIAIGRGFVILQKEEATLVLSMLGNAAEDGSLHVKSCIM